MTKTKTEHFEGAPGIRALQPNAMEGSARAVPDLAGGPVEQEATLAAEEMAFTRQGDIDAYARGLSIPPETIEKWISAGLLFPDEIRMAEKIIKILREKIKVS